MLFFKDFFSEAMQRCTLLTKNINKKSDEEKNREATEAIQTVIAKYGNSDDYSYFRSQVGAVVTSLESNISQSIKKQILKNQQLLKEQPMVSLTTAKST